MIEGWIIGVIINLCGNICINIGTNCVKYDHARARSSNHQHGSINSANSSVLSSAEQMDGVPNVPMPSNLQPSYLSQCTACCCGCWRRFLSHGRWWYIGWSMFTIGNIANFISLGFAPQSLLAALGSAQFFMNAVCEWYFNDHRITARMFKATCMIAVGNALIVAFASHESPKLTVDELFLLFFETAFDIYIVILLFFSLGLQVFYNETRKKLRAYQAAIVSLLAAGGNVHINGVGSGSGGSLHAGSGNGSGHGSAAGADHLHRADGGSGDGGSSHNQLGSQDRASDNRAHAAQLLPPQPVPLSPLRLRLLPFCYAAVSAIIGTQSVLLAKAISDLLRTSIAGNQQFAASFTWVIVACWISTIIFWLYRMDTALRKFEGPFIVPVLQVVWTLFSIIGGGIYYKEFNKMGSTAIILFTLGVIIMMFGVYLLAPQPTPHAADSVDREHHLHSAASSMRMSDVELAQGTSPYEQRDGRGADGQPQSVSPPVQIHGMRDAFLHDSDSHSGSGHGGSQPLQLQPHTTMILNPPPTKITRVTSTGRMVIQSDDRPQSSRSDSIGSYVAGDGVGYTVEVSPDFRPFESAKGNDSIARSTSSTGIAQGTRSTILAGPSNSNSRFEEVKENLTDEELSQPDQLTRQSDTDTPPRGLPSHALGMSKHTALPPLGGSSSSSGITVSAASSSSNAAKDRGVLGEAGLLDGVGVGCTPPLRPSVHWSTPTRPSTQETSFSRPPSASGRDSSHHGHFGSIPPSPMLQGFDPYAAQGATKRSRGMSLGFSMPMIDIAGESSP